MFTNLLKSSETIATAYSVASSVVEIGQGQGFGVSLNITNSAPAAGAFTAAVTNICTKNAHGYLTGLKVQVSSTTTLPGGLSGSTDYFVIYLSASTFSLAASLADAKAGTAIDITDTGTGTHTITPTALAGANYKIQGSIDGTVYSDIGSAVNITASASAIVEKVDVMYNYARVYYTMTAGQLSIDQIILVKG